MSEMGSAVKLQYTYILMNICQTSLLKEDEYIFFE